MAWKPLPSGKVASLPWWAAVCDTVARSRPSRGWVLTLGLGLLIAGWVGAFGYLAQHLRKDRLEGGALAAEQHALYLERHLSHALEAVELTADALEAALVPGLPVRATYLTLESTVRPLPFLRSLSILDAQGRVVVSSSDVNVGTRLALDGFYPAAAADNPRLRIGLPWSGRDIGRASPQPAGQAISPDASSVVPVLRPLPIEGGGYWLLAALNPDYFLSHAGLMLDPEAGHAVWLRYDGLVLMSGDLRDDVLPGTRDAVLAERLQAGAEHGRLERATANGREWLVAHRTSERFPVTVAVQLERASLLGSWRVEMQRLLWLLLPVLLALATALGLYQRHRWTLHAKQAELDRTNRLAASVFSNSRDAIIITDAQARIISVNDAFERVTGWSRRDVLGANPRLLSSGVQGQMFYRGMWDALNHTGHWQGELTNRRRNGELYPIRLSIAAVRGGDGALRHYTGVIVDITEQKAAEARLQVAAGVFVHAREGILIADPKGNIVDVNRAFTDITGYGREEVIGRNPRLLSSGHQDHAFYADMWRSLVETGTWSGEVWNRRKSGEVYSELLNISAVHDEHGRVQRYIGLFSDITQKKEYEAQLVRVAHFDALTGLPNRVLMADRLRQAMARSRRSGNKLAVLFLDLDGFKAVNDTFGHDAGDRLLIELSGRMRQVLRDEDTLARMGGDEFVGVLTGITDPLGCADMLNRLLDAASGPMTLQGDVLQVSASIGVTFYPQADEVDADQLLRQADQAMYQAKLSGKHRYHMFDAEQDRDMRARHQSVEHIQRALQQRELVLHYQPKVNMRTGEVLGMEALLRWQHPVEGLLPPGAFLPLLDGHPFMVELGQWVLAEALGQIVRWKAQGLSLPVSVNVDASQLNQCDFVEQIAALLAQHPQVAPGDLALELLETSALADIRRVSDVMVRCGELGVTFSLDDFGTGYSSLHYLRHLPARELKIDQGFVRNMLTDPEDLTILDGVIGLSQAFRRDVIAEGVETPEHGAMLLRLGCDVGQGYAIARAMPADDVPHWVAHWRPDSSWAGVQRLRREDLSRLFAEVEQRAQTLPASA